jgi:hypothetical protein
MVIILFFQMMVKQTNKQTKQLMLARDAWNKSNFSSREPILSFFSVQD